MADVYRYYGTIRQHDGRLAIATAASTGPAAISFGIPADVNPDQVRPGHPVYLKPDGTSARFTKFPIQLPSSTTIVGRGAGQGDFIVKTNNVAMSANGVITGQVQVKSDDPLTGFTGVLWLRLFDEQGAPRHTVRVGCWGVLKNTGLTEVWQTQVPIAVALVTRKVEVLVGNGECDVRQFARAANGLPAAAEATGAWAEVSARPLGTAVPGRTTPGRPRR